ncbi:MAG: PAS domain S-box protein [Proteobacteria bacterium]|nr:PAS domain S-box protein [Pseudomonadota bacterium]
MVQLDMRQPTTASEFRALLDAAVDGVIVTDSTGVIHVFNRSAERLFGFTSAEVLGRNVSMLMAGDDASRHDDHLQQYLRTRIPRIIGQGREVTAKRKDGKTFPAFLSVGVTDSTPVRFVSFVQDVSTRRHADEDGRRLQERLWHVSRLATMGEMASGIAHELNQPLAAIANYAQACDRLLAGSDPDIPEIRGALREITEQAVRAGDIIRKLRGLVTRSDGEARPTNINQLITELTNLIQASVRAHEIDFRLCLGSDIPVLRLQPVEIQQVILNLVRNAIESFPDGHQGARRVVIRTYATTDGDVAISVCDNGPGVAAHIAPSLFDPFCSSKENGTGLGLAMSRTMVSRHGGTLDYEPNSPAGACFTVRLPAATN